MAKVLDVKRNAVESVTLELDRDELVWLSTVLCRTGGSPTQSLRKHADAINNALRNMGIVASELARHDLVEKCAGSNGGGSMYWVDGV